MEEMVKILIGIAILIIGFPLGNFLARKTKEELKVGKKYFLAIILVCSIAAIVSASLRNDVLLFSFLFMMIVTSRSLVK